MKARIIIDKRTVRVFLSLIVFVVSLMVTGCESDRILTTVHVKDYGSDVTTRFRYRLFNRPDLEPMFEKWQPNVFSKSGIPIKLNDKDAYLGDWELFWRNLNFNHLSSLACFASCGVFPEISSRKGNKYVTIESVGLYSVNKRVEIDYDYKHVSVLPPLGLIYMAQDESMLADNGYRVFKKSGTIFSNLSAQFCKLGKDNICEAMVYGVASLLKDLEELGVIDVNFVKRMEKKTAAERTRRDQIVAEVAGYERMDRMASELKTREEAEMKKMAILQEKSKKEIEIPQKGNASKSPYRITMLCRDGNSDFAYVFTLELNGEPSIRTFFALQGVFSQEVLDAYKIEHPNVDTSCLRVVVKPRLDNGVIRGRAEVLTIVPLSLIYEANSRRGRLSVKFNLGQEKEARAWATENIETLARDKNIALVTGQLPPPGRYYSLGEKIVGNILEIEFKTE